MQRFATKDGLFDVELDFFKRYSNIGIQAHKTNTFIWVFIANENWEGTAPFLDLHCNDWVEWDKANQNIFIIYQNVSFLGIVDNRS